jgi:MATE family multidrug resistance protein
MRKQYNSDLKSLLVLSLPLIFSNLVNASSSLISMYLLSKLSVNALAAGAIITSTYGLIVMIVISILYSVSIMVGKMMGANQYTEIGPVVFAGCLIALAIGVPLTLVMLNMTPILELLNQPHHVSILAGNYFKGVAFGLIPSLIGAAFMQFFMGVGRTKVIFYLTVIGVIVNTILSYALIFGYQSIPVMGMFGGGLANAISAWILLVLTLIILLFTRSFSPYKLFHKDSIGFKYVSNLLRIGFPISIQYTAEILSFSVLTYMMGLIGTDALGAQQIALQCSTVSIMIVMAISQSGSILVSQAVGKGEIKSTSKIANSAQSLGFLFMLSIALIYWFAPTALIAVYLDINNPATSGMVSLIKNILIIAAFTQIFDGGRNIAAGLLRGFGDTKSSMWTGIISCWVIGIPFAAILGFYLDLGAIGVRLGIMLGILIGCIKLITRFYTFNKNNMGNQFAYAK